MVFAANEPEDPQIFLAKPVHRMREHMGPVTQLLVKYCATHKHTTIKGCFPEGTPERGGDFGQEGYLNVSLADAMPKAQGTTMLVPNPSDM